MWPLSSQMIGLFSTAPPLRKRIFQSISEPPSCNFFPVCHFCQWWQSDKTGAGQRHRIARCHQTWAQAGAAQRLGCPKKRTWRWDAAEKDQATGCRGGNEQRKLGPGEGKTEGKRWGKRRASSSPKIHSLELFAQFPGKSGSNLWNWLVLMYCSKAEFRAGFWVGRGTEASWKSRNAG